MKTVFMSLMLLAVASLNAIAQGTPHRELPEGAKARLDIGGGKVYDVKYSPDGTRLVAASTNGLWLYDSAASDPVALKSDRNPFRAFAVAFSPEGQTLAATARDSFGVWDAVTGELKHSHHVRKLLSLYFIRLFAFSPDVRTLAVATDGVLRLWDTETGELTHTLGGERFGDIMSLAFSPDGRTLASGHRAHGVWMSIADATIRLWDAATGELKDTLSEILSLPTNIAYSPDGRTLAVGHMHTAPGHDAWGWVTLWDAATGTLRHRLGGLTPDVLHIGSIRSLTFSPDGRTLAIVRWPASNSGDKLGTVRLWDTETGESTPTLEGYTDDVNSVTFSPDGYTLASGSSDHTVRLWNAATRENILTLEGHTDDVNSVTFSPDGGTLASGSSDGTLLLWEIIPPPDPSGRWAPPIRGASRSETRCEQRRGRGCSGPGGGCGAFGHNRGEPCGRERGWQSEHTGSGACCGDGRRFNGLTSHVFERRNDASHNPSQRVAGRGASARPGGPVDPKGNRIFGGPFGGADSGKDEAIAELPESVQSGDVDPVSAHPQFACPNLNI